MSWRETLGVTHTIQFSYAHNSQNTQKSIEPDNCADIADSAYRGATEKDSKMMEALSEACRGLTITPAEVKAALSRDDINNWRKGEISNETLAGFAKSLVQRRDMYQGKRPDHYTELATCKHCGPIWLWFPGEVLGCPWCWNRVADKPIPRPSAVHCSDCNHFVQTKHPHLGHCAKGEPEAIAGLWDTDRRYCELFLPRLL
ncbi:MAG: hypothetical protein JAY74_14810 [Candidatus Thiodiazotropha taylori]|nr:hypothetical protein [Candidatus Thiodiazotropha taylori]